MSLSLITSVLALALLDSINPSALFVTAIILSKSIADQRFNNIIAYVAGIYVSYFAVGLLLVLGADAIFSASAVTASIEYKLLLGGTGLAMLVYAFTARRYTPSTKKDKWSSRIAKALKPKYLVIFGAYMTITEILTAWPYFAAIGLLANAQTSTLTNIAILLIYCFIFVLPPLVVALLYKRHRVWFDNKMAQRTDEQRNKERESVLWIIGIIGFLLLVDSASKLGVFG